MIVAQDVMLALAKRDDERLLSNLLELYSHDSSDFFPLQLNGEGRFGYPDLPLYWSDEQHRFPFLIRLRQQPVGFALVTQGSWVTNDPDAFNMAEFFVARRYRREGVGRHAANELWRRLAGRWTVRVSEGNRSGFSFWSGIVHERFARGLTEFSQPGEPYPWRVFAFDTAN